LIKDTLKSDVIAIQEVSFTHMSSSGVPRCKPLDKIVDFLGLSWRYWTPWIDEIPDGHDNLFVVFLYNTSRVRLLDAYTMDVPNHKLGLGGYALFPRVPQVGYFEAKQNGQGKNDFALVNLHLKSGQPNEENQMVAMVVLEYELKRSLFRNGIKESDRIILGDFNDNPYEAVKVVGLSVHSDRFFVEAMLDAGASGYVVKRSAFRDLIEAIEAAVAGGFYVSAGLRGVTTVEYGDPDLAGSAAGARVAASVNGRRRVIFALEEPAAREVLLLGSFGNWEDRPQRMTQDKAGVWKASLWLPSGAHEYRFLVDGEWRNAPESDLVHNPFCGFNCLLRIA